MANPLSLPSLVEFVAGLARRVSALERRRFQVGARLLDELDDVEVPYGREDLASGYVLTLGTGGPTSSAGLLARFAPANPSDMAVSLTLTEQSDDGIFDEVTPFVFQPSVLINPHQYQLVIVDAIVDVSDTTIGSFLLNDGVTSADVYAPTPWQLAVYDSTAGLGADYVFGNCGVGSTRVSCAFWVHNDSDEDESHSLNLYVERAGYDPSLEFDGTVKITARTVFTLAPIP